MKKSRIEKKLKRKTNPELVETIIKNKKQKAWLGVAHAISTPRRKRFSINLDQIEKKSKDGDVIVIPGKVLGLGEVKKKIKISALKYSESAKKKLKDRKIEFNLIIEEIKSNPEAKKIKVL